MSSYIRPCFYGISEAQRFAAVPAATLFQISAFTEEQMRDADTRAEYLRRHTWRLVRLQPMEVADGRNPRCADGDVLMEGDVDAVLDELVRLGGADAAYYTTGFYFRTSGWFGEKFDHDGAMKGDLLARVKRAWKMAEAAEASDVREGWPAAHPDRFQFETADEKRVAHFVREFVESCIAHLLHTELRDEAPALNGLVFRASPARSTPAHLVTLGADGALQVQIGLALDASGVLSLHTGISCALSGVRYAEAKDMADNLSRLAGALHSIELEWQLRGRHEAQLVAA